MSSPPPDSEVATPELAGRDTVATTQVTSSLWRSNAPYVTAAVLAFAGMLRLSLRAQHDVAEPRPVHLILWAELDAGSARKVLAFPAALAPHAPFEIEAPRAAVLYSSAAAGSALVPTRCDEATCSYALGHHREVGERQIIAQLDRPGRYAFDVVQRTGYGEVRGSVALHVRP